MHANGLSYYGAHCVSTRPVSDKKAVFHNHKCPYVIPVNNTEAPELFFLKPKEQFRFKNKKPILLSKTRRRVT
jgi:hypothetical protein